MGIAGQLPASLRVEVLGELQVLAGGRPLPLPPSRRTRALLGYLAVQGRAQARQRLCALLWDGPDDPRGALRWSLAKVRPLVDGDRRRLVAEGDAVALALAPEELDLGAVRTCIPGGVERAAPEELRRAAGLFRGELLEGMEVPDCYPFEQWVAAERAAVRRLRLGMLDSLVRRCVDPEEALVYARARVAVDPLSEAGHVTVLGLLARLGRVREGLEQYDACRDILARVLGARPSPALERARLALTAARASPATGPWSGAIPAPRVEARVEARLAARPGPPRDQAAFVGRAAERAELGQLVAEVVEGRHRLLLVRGEPGVGKTRLLEELAAAFGAAGGWVARGRAYEAERLRPYAAWIDALREAPLDALDVPGRAALAPLLPELGEGPATDEHRLFEAVAQALAALAGRAPLALILDDAQWLDDRSSALLHYVARSWGGRPLLLACAVRPGELADNPAVLHVARALSRADAVRRLELGPLAPEEVAALTAALGPGLDAARVYRESEGNPLLALEVARALRDGADPSRSLDALLAERFERLEGRARAVLPWAAVLGRSFRADRLAHVAGIPAAELLPGIEELERRGVLRPGAAADYDFAHDLLRRAAYRALSAPRRQLLHREVARALAPLPDPDGALAGEVAHHAALGEDAELAAQASVAAAARAARLFACAEARSLVERGLAFAQRLPEPTRLSLSLALLRVAVDSSRAVGGDPDLVPRLEALVEEARACGLAAEEAAGHGILATARAADREPAQASASPGQGGLSAVEPDGAAVVMGEVAGCLALLERDIPRARMLIEECRRLGRAPPRAAVYVATAAGIIQALDGALEGAARTFEQALEQVAEGAPWEESVLLARLALVELALGRPERALDRAARIEAVAPRLRATEALVPRALRAVARRQLGEPVPDAALLEALAPLELDAKGRFAELACALAERELDQGRAEPSRSLLARAGRAAERVCRPSLIVTARALLARAELAAGDDEAARRQLEAARQGLTPSVPMARAALLVEEVARELARVPTPLAPGPAVESLRGDA